jgi:DNA-binding response OmpR family regulator
MKNHVAEDQRRHSLGELRAASDVQHGTGTRGLPMRRTDPMHEWPATLAIVRLNSVDANTEHLDEVTRKLPAKVIELSWPLSLDGSVAFQDVQCWILRTSMLDVSTSHCIASLRANFPVAGLLIVAEFCSRDATRCAIRDGADDCLSAEDTDWVYERVSALLRHRFGTCPAALGTIELDEGELTVRLDAITTRLTLTEFRIVQYLWKRRELWVSHGELMQNVLGMANAADTALIRVHLSNIRRKLPRGADLLLTRRQLGTRLCLPQVRARAQL